MFYAVVALVRGTFYDSDDGLVSGVIELPTLTSLLGKDSALILRADDTAPVFNDEEIRARATAQVHKVAREDDRCDVGTCAVWAGCGQAITLFAGARHVGMSSFPARNVPADPQTIRAKLRAVGTGCYVEVVGSDTFGLLWPFAHGALCPWRSRQCEELPLMWTKRQNPSVSRLLSRNVKKP
jgi:hypothetical protein